MPSKRFADAVCVAAPDPGADPEPGTGMSFTGGTPSLPNHSPRSQAVELSPM